MGHMQHCLAKLFTSMLKGTYPTSLSTGLVTAVYKGKRKDPLNMNSYRPITVVPVLAKLFATVMEQRMTRWAEGCNFRAPPQAGFRRGHSTAGQLSIVNISVPKIISASFSAALLILRRPSTRWIAGCCGLSYKIWGCVDTS